MILVQADSVSPIRGVRGRRSAQTQFRPDIECLCAVAVSAVVLFHAEIPGVGGGFVGLAVFFVISGFLITGLLWREASDTRDRAVAPLLWARARRLLPRVCHHRRHHHDRRGCSRPPSTE